MKQSVFYKSSRLDGINSFSLDAGSTALHKSTEKDHFESCYGNINKKM